MTNKITLTSIIDESGLYAGWPANHGRWQWDNEILIGFICGEYFNDSKDYHKVDRQKLCFKQARSLDYGMTWEVEDVNIPLKFSDKDLKKYKGNIKKDIFRIRGNYDHGGDDLDSHGGFYASSDKGKIWNGPYRFDGLTFEKGYENSSRTCIIDNIFFLTQKKKDKWGTDEIIPAKFEDNKFHFIEKMKLSKDYRTVMPSVVNTHLGLVMAVRAKFKYMDRYDNHIDIYLFKNDKWNFIRDIYTGDVKNGNPPALFYKNKKIFLFYGNRKSQELICEYTENLIGWQGDMIYESKTQDFGYPIAFDAGDKGVGVAFYEDNGINKSSINVCTIK